MIEIYTDGSCLGNPGAGGWAALIIHVGKEKVLTGGDPDTTNNRMEMTAILEGLQWLVKKGIDENVAFYSDSSLVIQTLTKGWKRKTNTDIWDQMDAALGELSGIDIQWNWVKGHANHTENERVDKLAVAESKKQISNGAAKPQSKPKSKSGLYLCNNCKKEGIGVLSFMPDSEMIRVDCDNCGKYIMFGEKTPENLKEAKKRVLISKKQLEFVSDILEDQGKKPSEKMIKELKTWTKEKASNFISENQTLF